MTDCGFEGLSAKKFDGTDWNATALSDVLAPRSPAMIIMPQVVPLADVVAQG